MSKPVYSIIYIHAVQCRGQNRTEQRCGTSAFISYGIDISPLVESLNFVWERKELGSIVILLVKIPVYTIYVKKYQGAMMPKAFALSVRQDRMQPSA
jgi:hypothetical protein